MSLFFTFPFETTHWVAFKLRQSQNTNMLRTMTCLRWLALPTNFLTKAGIWDCAKTKQWGSDMTCYYSRRHRGAAWPPVCLYFLALLSHISSCCSVQRSNFSNACLLLLTALATVSTCEQLCPSVKKIISTFQKAQFCQSAAEVGRQPSSALWLSQLSHRDLQSGAWLFLLFIITEWAHKGRYGWSDVALTLLTPL